MKKADNVREGIDKVMENTFDRIIIGEIPSKEQQDKDKINIRQKIIGNNEDDKQYIDFLEKTSIFFVCNFRNRRIYGVVAENGKNIGGYADEQGNPLISIRTIKEYLNDSNFKLRYEDALKILGYREENQNGESKMYKISNDGKKEYSVENNSLEYFVIFAQINKAMIIFNIRDYVSNKGKYDEVKNEIKDGVLRKVLTFENIEDMKSNNQITENEFKQLVPQISDYYFSLVYTGLISREKAKEKTQEYFKKGYINSKIKDDANYFLDTGNLPK